MTCSNFIFFSFPYACGCGGRRIRAVCAPELNLKMLPRCFDTSKRWILKGLRGKWEEQGRVLNLMFPDAIVQHQVLLSDVTF